MAGDNQETLSPAETERRREAALKRMLSTPHKPHKAKAKPRRKKSKKGA